MSINLKLPKLTDLKPRIAVIGVGGAGGNAINNMIAAGLSGVEFIVANTDAQALAASSAEHRIQLGANLTEGLGAGSKPEIGEAAAEEALDDIRTQVSGCHMVFIAAGMGGGTGTGAASVIARIARDLGILTVAVVTKPFQFEGSRRLRIAETGIADLKNHVDTIIVIPNQNLFRIANEKTTFAEAFVLADQVLYSGIACIVDLIVKEGLINLDLADVRAVLSGMGTAMMGTGEAEGDRRAILAAEEAIANPLIDDVTLRGARGLLLSIIGGANLTLYEVDEAASRVRQEVDPEANIIVGATFDESMGDRVRVSIVASGMSRVSANVSATPPPISPVPQVAPAAAPSVQNWHPQAKQNTPAAPPPLPEQRPVSAHAPRVAAMEQAPRPASVTADPLFDSPYRPEPWLDGSDVQIEEAPPQLSDMPGTTRTYERSAQPEGAQTMVVPEFAPKAPAEVRRAVRRMPDLEEFPPHAQREFMSKTAMQDPALAAPRAYQTPVVEAKKSSLLQRLTGGALGRRQGQDTGVSRDAKPGRNAAPELPDFFQTGKKSG
jgi:cell division protein FtsZ